MAATSLSDERRMERLLASLTEQTDAQAIVTLLTLHKLAEHHATGRLRELLALDATAIFHLLERFAPEAMGDALAVWYEGMSETAV